MKKVMVLLIGFVATASHAVAGDLQVSGSVTVGTSSSKISQSSSTYGALTVTGTKNGYGGINFKDGSNNNLTTLMTNGPYSGFYNPFDTGWTFYTSGGASYFYSPVWAGGYYVNSDRSLKENIVKVTNVSDKASLIYAYNYYWKDKAKGVNKELGFLADEVEAQFPELVREFDDPQYGKIKTVSYTSFVPVLLEMVKELKQKNLELENRVKILESR